MSSEIITLTSSDEEDNWKEPPLKKLKTLNLTECTLSVIPKKPKSEADIPVVIDSEDELEEKLDDTKNSSSLVHNKQSVNDTEKNIDLITLTDDENDECNNAAIMNDKPENNCKNSDETVSLSDSDSDIETSKKNGIVENLSKKCITSIMINDSDEEPKKNENKENDNNEKNKLETDSDCTKIISNDEANNLNNSKVENTNNIDAIPTVSQTKPSDIKTLFKDFLQLVEEKIANSTFAEISSTKMSVIQKYFSKCEAYVKEQSFYQLLRNSIDEINKSPNSNAANCAVITFHKVCKDLKAHVSQTTIEIEEDDVTKVKMLERTINLLIMKIRNLEDSEVDFEADENSSYIQLDRYQVRLNKVYKKYCSYIKKNPYMGRPVYDRITFVNSNYNAINLALTQKYSNSLAFPSYYEMTKYIKKVANENKLGLTDEQITVESKKCFKSLGSILQKKRRQELYDSHLAFIETTEDPAKNDISLENILKKNQKDGEEKIREVCQKFVDLADRGEDHVSSGHSSNESESDADEKLENNQSHKIRKKKVDDEDNVDVKGGNSDATALSVTEFV